MDESVHGLVTLHTDIKTLPGLSDMVPAHVHTVVMAMEHLSVFPLCADRANKRTFFQCILPGRQQGRLEISGILRKKDDRFKGLW
jgi:hypothetical protein